MSKITEFNKPTLRTLRSEIDTALAEIGKTYGIDLRTGNARYDAKTATFKLNCSMLNESGDVETKEMIDLKAFHPALVNKEVKMNGGQVGIVIGFNARRHKYPFIVSTPKGRYKLTAGQVGAARIPRG